MRAMSEDVQGAVADEVDLPEIEWETYSGTLYDDDVVRTLEDAETRGLAHVGAGASLTGEVIPTWRTMLVGVEVGGVRQIVVVPRSGRACFLAPEGVDETYRFEADRSVIALEGYWPGA